MRIISRNDVKFQIIMRNARPHGRRRFTSTRNLNKGITLEFSY